MPSALSSLINAAVTPMGTTLALGAAGWLCLASSRRSSRRRRTGLALIALGLGWLALCSTPSASQWFRATLEDRYPAVPVEQLPQADAIVVLGGGAVPAVPGERPYAEVMAAGDRVLHAARLWRAGKAPLVLASGDFRSPRIARPELGEAGAMQDLLVELGVPADRVLMEPDSADTEQNAEFSARILSARGARHVLLVTSALHMRRAHWLFERAGLRVTPASTDVETAGRRLTWRGLLPETAALDGSYRALKEWLGWWALQWFGGTPH